MLWVIEAIAYYIGVFLIVVGSIMNLLASIGFNRLKDFYLRLHTVMLGVVGGGFYPLIGLTLVSLTLDEIGVIRYYIAGGALITSILLILVAPTNIHILAKHTHKLKLAIPKQAIVNKLLEDMEVGEK